MLVWRALIRVWTSQYKETLCEKDFLHIPISSVSGQSLALQHKDLTLTCKEQFSLSRS